MDKQLEKIAIPCINDCCTGSLQGSYGGEFFIEKVKYTQVLNCKCDRCGLERKEAFEVWDEYHQEYWVGDYVTIPLDDECDINFPGLGMPASQTDSDYFLEKINDLRQEFFSQD